MKYSKNDKIWEDLITGKESVKYNNYLIKIKVHQLQNDYIKKKKTLEVCVNELFEIYKKYHILFDKDIKYHSKKIIRKSYTIDEVTSFINNGRILSLSGDEKILNKLPKGSWIAGTTPYFMDTVGGLFTEERIFVDDLTDFVEDVKIKIYDKQNIENIATDGFDNGFTILILPLNSDALTQFAYNSLNFKEIYKNPIIGYVAGMNLKLLGSQTAKTYYGPNTKQLENEGVAIHVKLKNNQIASTEIINLNTIDENSPTIIFPKTDFTQSKCTINGKDSNIADFITEIDYRLPLIADYQGALINRDIKNINTKQKEVSFFSPLFKEEKYRLVNQIDNYHKKFIDSLQNVNTEQIAYSTVCVSYLGLGKLEGKQIPVTGPFAFGEISYMLLNQTLVYLKIINT